jgi:hypothetical protein
MGGACSTWKVEERCLRGFMENPEGEASFGMPRHRWEDNIKMYLQ